MRFHLFKNDKTTAWDEVILAVMILISITIGILLIICRPAVLFISSTDSCMFGVLFTLFGIMFLPGLLYRLLTNGKQ